MELAIIPSYVKEIDKFGGRRTLVWISVMLDIRTPQHIFDAGTVNAYRYRDEVLEVCVRLSLGAVGPQLHMYAR